jgi:hypothetical protein
MTDEDFIKRYTGATRTTAGYDERITSLKPKNLDNWFFVIVETTLPDLSVTKNLWMMHSSDIESTFTPLAQTDKNHQKIKWV